MSSLLIFYFNFFLKWLNELVMNLFLVSYCFICRLIIVSALYYASEMSHTKSELLEDSWFKSEA